MEPDDVPLDLEVLLLFWLHSSHPEEGLGLYRLVDIGQLRRGNEIFFWAEGAGGRWL